MNPEEFYKSRKDFFSTELIYNSKKIIRISMLRLLSLTAGIYFLVLAIRRDEIIMYPASLALIVLFLVLVVYHRNLNRLASRLKILVSVNENELNALTGEFSSFEDGTEFLDINHEYTYDLDIFGKKSLFQYINRCCTLEGKLQLAGKFTNSPLAVDKITRYRGIFIELSEEPEFMQDFLSIGMLADDNPGEKDEIISWMVEKSFVTGFISGLLIFLLPIVNILIIFAGIYSTSWFNLLYLSLPVSWIFYGIYIKRINDYHNMISRKQEILGKYLDLNKIIAQKKFRNEELQKMSDDCHHSITEFRKLEKLVNYLDSRMNILVGIALNTVFLYDFHIIRKLEQWKDRNTGLGKAFFEIPAEFDSSISLAVYKFNNPGFCTPEIGNARLAAKSVSHPLIPQSQRVSNDFLAEDNNKLFIITGANMAGKSTFLRTLGVNMILAGMGAPVCAESMIFRPVKIITGMRTTDSLAESESYFFAELKRLQKITEKLESGESLFILLDEILKGTNSIDKHKGSVALVNKLVKLNCLALIATHDLSLGEEEKKYPEEISNLSFESYILDGELSFDYKLSKGIAKNMNAYFLMKKMGIV